MTRSLGCLLATACVAAAHPVAYKGAWQLMLGGSENFQHLELYRSYTPKEALGVHLMHFKDAGKHEKFALVQHNWLLKRWNLPEAQANFYAGLCAGVGSVEDESWDPAGMGFLRLDYETRQIFSAFDTRFFRTDDIERSITSASIGYTPWLTDFDKMSTWFILQAEHVSGMEDEFDIIPKVRLFKDNWFVEIGCTLGGEPVGHIMWHF